MGRNRWGGFPLRATREIPTLGVAIEMHFAIDEHYEDMITKAQIRLGIRRKVVGDAWGLKTGILVMTHDAGVARLVRYAPVVTGSCLPPGPMRSVISQIVNVVARPGSADRKFSLYDGRSDDIQLLCSPLCRVP